MEFLHRLTMNRICPPDDKAVSVWPISFSQTSQTFLWRMVVVVDVETTFYVYIAPIAPI